MNVKFFYLIIFLTLYSCSEKEIDEVKLKDNKSDTIYYKESIDSSNDTIFRWVKGNLHTHSFWSDGDEFPEEIVDWYKKNGYQFIALSDHNIIHDGNKNVFFKKGGETYNNFKNYLQKYGEQWVKYYYNNEIAIVKLKKLNEYRQLFEEYEKFIIINSEEISDVIQNKDVHINATNLVNLIQPQGGLSVKENLQKTIDVINEQSIRFNTPILPIINHPNYGNSISIDDLISINGNRFIEIFNGSIGVHNFGNYGRMSNEQIWDFVNIAYIRDKKPLLYGIAADDTHHYHQKGKKWHNAGRGWIMVYVNKLNTPTIISSMLQGMFYASTGVVLKEYSYKKNIIKISVLEEDGVKYNISFIGCKKGSLKTEILKTIEGNEGFFELTEDLLFVRCKISSSKLLDDFKEDNIFETAWTNPEVYIKQ